MEELTNFKPEELIGKFVIISNRYGSSVGKISRVTKSYFGIENSENLFSLKNGDLRGNDAWNFTSAKLISKDEAKKQIGAWKKKKESKEMCDIIVRKINMNTISHSQLTEIIKIINKKS